MALSYYQERDFGYATLKGFVEEVATFLPGWTTYQRYEHSIILQYGKIEVFCRLAKNSKEDNIKITYSSSSCVTEGHKTHQLWSNWEDSALFETTQTTNKTAERVAKTLKPKLDAFINEWRVKYGKHLETQAYYSRKADLATRLGNLIGASEPGSDKNRRGKFNYGQTTYTEIKVSGEDAVELTLSGLSEDKVKEIIALVS